LSSTDLGGESLLVTTGVPGVQASELIAHRPGSRDALVDRIAGWLERWNTSTAVDGVLSEDLLERALLAPARFLALERPHIAALEQLAAAAAGHRVKLVAAHNDLTTANVLVEGGSSLAVVDWESAEPEGLPLADLLYAVADAQAAAHSFADRPGAFVASLDRQALHEARLVERLGLHPLVADACFHACWLHHAVNERRSVEPDAGTPFLEIVRAIWARRLRLADAA
jgi:hypothetical protein